MLLLCILQIILNFVNPQSSQLKFFREIQNLQNFQDWVREERKS